MKYFTEKPDNYTVLHGETYECNHMVYSKCTLFRINHTGLAVIQQRFNAYDKSTYWTEIDPWLNDKLYLHPDFLKYYTRYARERAEDGTYPTVTIRQIMWALRMKPLRRFPWETVFDKAPILLVKEEDKC